MVVIKLFTPFTERTTTAVARTSETVNCRADQVHQVDEPRFAKFAREKAGPVPGADHFPDQSAEL